MGETDFLDLKGFGASIKAARISAGFKKASDLADRLEQATGVKVSKETLYKIESGKAEPKLSLYLALMRVLHPYEVIEIDDEVMDNLPDEWMEPLMVPQSEAKNVRIIATTPEAEKALDGFEVMFKNFFPDIKFVNIGSEYDSSKEQ